MRAEQILRELIDMKAWTDGDYGPYCFFCSADGYGPHSGDCIYIAARKLLGETIPEFVYGPPAEFTKRIVMKNANRVPMGDIGVDSMGLFEPNLNSVDLEERINLTESGREHLAST